MEVAESATIPAFRRQSLRIGNVIFDQGDLPKQRSRESILSIPGSIQRAETNYGPSDRAAAQFARPRPTGRYGIGR